MEKITFTKIQDVLSNEILEYAVIDRGNEEFTSMPKSEYDRRQAEQSTPIVKDEATTQ
jgi:hypothetical protein